MKGRCRRLAATIGAVLLAAACSKTPRQHLDAGNAYLREGKPREAAIEFRAAAAGDPNLAEAQVGLADVMMRVGNDQGALGAMERAAKLLPKDAGVQTRAGTLMLLAGRHADARARAEQALAVEPNRVDALVLHANALAGLSDLDGAVGEMERALQLEPTAGVYVNLGTILVARQEPAQAEAAFKRAIAAAPTQAAPQLALAHYYWAARRLPEAERTFQAALGVEPKHPLALRVTALFYVSTGRPALAEPYVKRRAEAGGIEPRLELASYYLGMNRPDDATKVLEALSSVKGAWAIARTNLAFIALARGDSARAQAIADEVLAREPLSVEALVMKARAQAARKEWDGALETLGRALRTDKKSEAALYLRGRIDATRRNYDEAARDFQQAVQVNPRAGAAHLALARVELARGQPAAAVQRAEAAVLAGGGVAARLMLVNAYLVQGRVADADREITIAVAEAPKSSEVQVQLARVRLAQGREVPAREAFAKGLTLDPTSVPALAGVAQIELRGGRAAAARARVQQAADARPTDARLWLLLGRLALATKDPVGAERALRRAVTEDPDTLDAYGLLAQLYVQRGEVDRAEKELAAIVARHPRPLGARILLGIFAQSRGKAADAEAHYAAALALDPHAAVAANNLAGLLAARGQLERAAALAKQAAADLPDRAEVSDTLADIYMRQSLPALAAPLWREAVERDPQPAYRYRLARALRALGRGDEARHELELALASTQRFAERADAEKALAELRKPAGP